MVAALALGLACRTPGTPPASSAPAEPVSGGVEVNMLDRKTDPCTDFYQFACGSWLDQAVIPPDKPMWDRTFTMGTERNREELRKILEAAAAGKGDARDAYVDKLGAFYGACMDEGAIESQGRAELAAELAKIDTVKDAATLAAAVGQLHAVGVDALFTFGSEQDAKDATKVIAGLYQGGLGLPDRDFYLRTDAKSQGILAAYEVHVGKMLGLAGLARPEKLARTVVDIEKRLASTHWTRVEMRDPVRTYNRVERSGLEKLAAAFPWQTYLTALGRADVTTINASTPKNVEAIGALVKAVPFADWRSYLKWRFIDGWAEALPKAFVDQDFAFGSAHITGQKELPVRWKRCVRASDDALGEALGQIYVRLHFGPEAKDRTTRMIAEIEARFGQNLEALAWMDQPTRQKGLAKLHKVANKIGYPDVWRNYDALAVSRKSYLGNRLAASAFEHRRDLDKVGKPLDRKEWLMTPPAVNAYYHPQLNEMVFPAGILQPPVYNRAAGSAVNYGALGMIAGHELTHGFDDQGRQYDADGNLTEWWSPKVAEDFKQRAQCLVKQYDAYIAVDDVHLNGELTLGENIADLGGLKLAYAAFQATLAGKPAPPPTDGFTVEQQFFLGMGQAWCTKLRDTFARTIAQIDPHSPARYRVNGPLSNMPEFAAAFSCKEGSPMAKPAATRCEVW